MSYFNSCDAFTGEPLDLSQDDKWGFTYLVPPILGGLEIIQNVVPVLVDTIDCMDEYMPTWFQEQSFFDVDRFLAITNWMGCSKYLAHMSKYKYVPSEQLRYIDTFDNNVSMNKFAIIKPDYKTATLYYSNRLNRRAFCNQVYNNLISDIEDDLINNWLETDSYDKITSTHRILDRCADYILNGELDYHGNIRYLKHELAASNISSDMLDMFEYGDRSDSARFNVEYKYEMSIIENTEQQRNDGRRKKYQTTFSKINKLFTQPAYKKLRVVKLKDELGNDLKNIFNHHSVDMQWIEYDKIDGIINPEKEYTIDWCYVWSSGEFEFNGTKYQIDIGKNPQYTDISKTKRKGNNLYWSMDKILCINQFDKTHFFDMDISEIHDVYQVISEQGGGLI